MTSWYYSQADQVVGPLQAAVLGQLLHAGVINEATPVRNADEDEWQPLAAVLAEQSDLAHWPPQDEARYYYLDAADQPIGPFDIATLQRLNAEKVLTPETLISSVGDPEWVPAAKVLGITTSLIPGETGPSTDQESTHPTYRKFGQFALVMGVSLTLYQFYLVPLQSRDIKAITGRPRMEFTALLILGILTLGFLLLVMLVLWAFDLERHGKAMKKPGRQESLGAIVLCLAAFGRVLPFAIDAALPAFLLEVSLIFGAIWMVQREINLYAAPPEDTPI